MFSVEMKSNIFMQNMKLISENEQKIAKTVQITVS